MHKQGIWAGILSLTLLSGNAFAQNMHQSKSFGLGVGGGVITNGLTAKGFVRSDLAVQGFLGWYGPWSTNIGVDVIHEGRQLWTNGDFGINWEVGAGVAAWFWNRGFTSESTALAVNGVLGLSFQFRPVPLEFVIDLRPTFTLGSYRGGFYLFNSGAALRFYF